MAHWVRTFHFETLLLACTYRALNLQWQLFYDCNVWLSSCISLHCSFNRNHMVRFILQIPLVTNSRWIWLPFSIFIPSSTQQSNFHFRAHKPTNTLGILVKTFTTVESWQMFCEKRTSAIILMIYNYSNLRRDKLSIHWHGEHILCEHIIFAYIFMMMCIFALWFIMRYCFAQELSSPEY